MSSPSPTSPSPSPTSPTSFPSPTSSPSSISPAKHTPSLHDLPLDVLRIIARYYRELQRQDAASTLQAALRRHVLTRCEHPRHAGRTNTPGEGLVPCYRACHEHPRRLWCTGLSREEYFKHIIGGAGLG